MHRHLTLTAALLLVTACGQEADPPSNGDPGTTGITIDAPATVISGQTISLRAALQGSADSLNGLSWSTSGGGSFSDALANPVSFTAPQVSSATQIRITVTLAADAARSATIEITVLPEGSFQAVVNPDLQPVQPSIPDRDGNARVIACSVDSQGVQSDFIEGEVLVRPASEAELNDFLRRYDGTVLSDNAVPEPPPELGVVMDPEYRTPTEYLVRINLDTVDLSDFSVDAAAFGLSGVMSFSSQAGLTTMAAVADAVAAGFNTGPNFISYPDQAFPLTLLSTQERPDAMGVFADAFATDRFQSTGSRASIIQAWQFVGAHGIKERVEVAIVDDGFWLDTNGKPLGTDTDFPANPVQYDFIDKDYVADGPGIIGCGTGNPCFWHGTGAAGVATGLINNRAGAAGTGAFVADPILLQRAGSRDNDNLAVRTAVAWGADVISMSFSGACNQVCVEDLQKKKSVFDDEVGKGSRAVFVAAAGNGECPAGVMCPPGVFTGFEVGGSRLLYPCSAEHVICVGALNDNAATKIGYSNFGASVDIFAPTNIPVMTQPAANDSNPSGPAAPRVFRGTSAATPFVAGVAAMVKAINPNLNSNEVSNILRETAYRGALAVDYHINAYAAVVRAARDIDAVKDRLEVGPTGNDNANAATNLAGAASWNQANLNVHRPTDRDYFRIEAPGLSLLTIQHPEVLGALSLFNLDELQGTCGAPALVGDVVVTGRSRTLTYQLPGGRYVLGVGAGELNAYNLQMSPGAGGSLPLDAYEQNDAPETAELLTLSQPADGVYAVRDDRVKINATIHSAGDLDHYIVRGVRISLVDLVYYRSAYPVIQVYGNESPITLEVYVPPPPPGPDGTPGPCEMDSTVPGWCRVGRSSSPSCTAQPVAVPLTEGELHLVKVSGGVGRYELSNRIDGEPRTLPYLVRDRVYEVLHPGEPVEDGIPFPKLKVFVADAAFSEIKLTGADLHLELFDFDGNPVTEGQPGGEPGCDEILDLAVTRPGDIYTLQITPLTTDPDGLPLRLEWQPAAPAQVSGNLILNPGAEDGPAEEEPGGDGVNEIPNWYVPVNPPGAVILPMASMPTVLYYDDNAILAPTSTAPGPDERGIKLFAGGPYSSPSAIQQFVTVDSAWNPAIDAGRVRFTMSAFLGGSLAEGDAAQVSLEFRTGDDFELLGSVTLPSITPLERQDQTGLWPVTGGGVVPAGTNFILVTLAFVKTEGDYTDAYADNLELTLAEYGG